MSGFEISLRFVSADDGEAVTRRLRNLDLPDGEVIEEGAAVYVTLRSAANIEAALTRGLAIVRSACEGTDVLPERVSLSASVWPGS